MSERNKEWMWLFVVFALLIGILPMLLWRPWAGYMHGMMGMMGYGWGFMFLAPVIFLFLIFLGAYYLITEYTRTGRSESGRGEKAIEILRERYAKGEITSEQYLKMKKELES